MTVEYITKQGEVERLLPILMTRGSWGADTETTGLDPHVDKVTLLQLGNRDIQYVIDTRKVSVEPLRPFFADKEVRKIFHNFKFDYKMIKGSFGIDVEGGRDTMLGEKLLNVGRKKFGFGLADLLSSRIGLVIDKAQQKTFIGHTGDFSAEQIEYAAADVRHMIPLYMDVTKDITAAGLRDTFVLECEAVPCFGDMEFGGLILDQPGWKAIMDSNAASIEEITAELDEFSQHFFNTNLFGKVDINYGSPAQVLELFSRLRITVEVENFRDGTKVRLPVTDTNDKTLKKIKGYPAVELLKKYRSHSVRLNTFGQPFLDGVHKATGKIHPEFDQLGTETGRPASRKSSPVNMLNIPRDRAMRECFVGGDDHVIETDDFSGCELRIWAEISKDPLLVKAFAEKQDVHCVVATKLFRVPVTKDNENKKLRTPAKGLNFGIAYGMGPKSLYDKLNGEGYPIEFEAAKKLYYTYCDEFRVGVDFLRNAGRRAVSEGYLANLNGRKRHWLIPNPNEREKYPRGENDSAYKGRIGGIEREGGNFLIQSVNADMTKRAMVLIRDYKKKHGIRTEFVNQVYDEVVTRTHKDDTEAFHPVKQKLMLDAAHESLKSVPMEVEGHVGPSWTK